jgi:hypothetical protein
VNADPSAPSHSWVGTGWSRLRTRNVGIALRHGGQLDDLHGDEPRELG